MSSNATQEQMAISQSIESRDERLSLSLLSSYASRGIVLLLPLVMAPILLKKFGSEVYGLVGVFVVIQSIISLLDLGIAPTVAREFAALRGKNASADKFCNLLYTVEIAYFILAALALFVGLAASVAIAHYWINIRSILEHDAAFAFSIMCLGATANFIAGLFGATLLALNRQVQYNLTAAGFQVAGAVVAILGLLYLSWGVFLYFAWQAITSLSSLFVIRRLAWKSMPKFWARPVFQKSVITSLRRLAAGLSITQVMAALSMNMDRIFLSRLLPAEIFGFYALAAALSSSLLGLVYPIVAVASPRLTLAFNSTDCKLAMPQYHFYAQMICVVVTPATLTVAIFAEPLLLAWTQNIDAVNYAALPLRILALGWLFNALMCLPYAAQLAHGWVRLGAYGLFIGLALQIPALLYFVPRYGLDAAAWSWLVMEFGFFIVAVPVMHKKIMQGHAKEWYWNDNIIPAIAAFLVLGICHIVFHQLDQHIEFSRPWIFVYLGTSTCLGSLAAVLAAARVRSVVFGFIRWNVAST